MQLSNFKEIDKMRQKIIPAMDEEIYDLLSRYGWEDDERYYFFFEFPGLGYDLSVIKDVLEVLWPEPDEADYGPAREEEKGDDDFFHGTDPDGDEFWPVRNAVRGFHGGYLQR